VLGEMKDPICIYNSAVYFADKQLRTVQRSQYELSDEEAARLEIRREDLHLPNLHLIISTGAGALGAENFAKDVLVPLLETLQVSFDTHLTTSATSHQEYAAQRIHNDPTLVFLAGDTTVSQTINALPSHLTPSIILFPFGTANALYHSLDLSSPLTNLIFGRPRPIQTFGVTIGTRVETHTRTALVVASWGLHASLVADAEELRNEGPQKFAIAVQRHLYPAHAYNGRVSFNGHDFTQSAYVLVTNRRKLEETFTVSPSSNTENENLYMVYIGAMEGSELKDIIMSGYNGDFSKAEGVVYEEVDEVDVTVEEDDPRWMRTCVDGEIHSNTVSLHIARGKGRTVYLHHIPTSSQPPYLYPTSSE